MFYLLQVKCGFFTECQSKSLVDSHFGHISRWYNEHCNCTKDGIHTTSKLCKVIRQSHRKALKAARNKNSNKKETTLSFEDTDERPLEVKAYNFDINHLSNEYTEPLRQSLFNNIHLQYRINIPDITSFGCFVSFRTKEGSLQYQKFRRNRKYHKVRKERFGEVERERVELLTNWDIVFNSNKDTLDNWCKRMEQKNSGQSINIYVTANPTVAFFKSYAMTCAYNVTIIPKTTMVKKQDHVEGVKTAELLRKQTARKKYTWKRPMAQVVSCDNVLV